MTVNCGAQRISGSLWLYFFRWLCLLFFLQASPEKAFCVSYSQCKKLYRTANLEKKDATRLLSKAEQVHFFAKAVQCYCLLHKKSQDLLHMKNLAKVHRRASVVLQKAKPLSARYHQRLAWIVYRQYTQRMPAEWKKIRPDEALQIQKALDNLQQGVRDANLTVLSKVQDASLTLSLRGEWGSCVSKGARVRWRCRDRSWQPRLSSCALYPTSFFRNSPTGVLSLPSGRYTLQVKRKSWQVSSFSIVLRPNQGHTVSLFAPPAQTWVSVRLTQAPIVKNLRTLTEQTSLRVGFWTSGGITLAVGVGFVVSGVVMGVQSESSFAAASREAYTAKPWVFLFRQAEQQSTTSQALFIAAAVVGGVGLALTGAALWFSARSPRAKPPPVDGNSSRAERVLFQPDFEIRQPHVP